MSARLTKREREIVILVLHYAQGRELYPWSSQDGQDMASAMRKLQGTGKVADAPLAGPPAVAPGSASSSEEKDDHMTRAKE